MNEDYRVEIRVKNNNILKRIENAGYKTVKEFCDLNEELNGKQTSIYNVINMKESPMNQNSGKFKQWVEDAALILDCMPEDFFTDAQLNAVLETNKRVFQVDENEMRLMLESHPDHMLLEDIVAKEEKKKLTMEMLETLTPREAKVLTVRFGLGDTEPLTLEQTGKLFDVTRERIRHIEAKALRKLRHPSRAIIVNDFICDQ